MSPDPRRWGVRARTTLLSVLLAAGILTMSAVVLVNVTRSRIEAAIVEDATERAAELVALAGAGALADPLPGPDTELFAQVVDGTGAVVGADVSLAGQGPLPGSVPALGGRTVTRVETLYDPTGTSSDDLVAEGPYVVVTEAVRLDGGTGGVRVAASLEDAAVAVTATLPLSIVGIPLLAGAVGVITWFLTGRALHPVERMRAEAERISGTELDRRLPVPGTADEIHALAETLNRMLDRIEGSATEMRRFVADASHELQSPLTSLGAMVDVTRLGTADAELSAVLDDLGAEIDRMQRLVGDLLFLARHDETRPPLDWGEVDLDQLVRAEAGSVKRRGTVKVVMSAVGAVRVIGDQHQLERLVRNLTDNAGRHAATTVWLATGQEDGVAVLSVSDDGPGIAASDRDRVFDRFVRLDGSRDRATGGTGLGLAVVRAIARSHHGEAAVVEARHGGATFEVRIPVGGEGGLER